MEEENNRSMNLGRKEYPKLFCNLYETLKNSAEKFPNKVSVIDDNGKITYQEFIHKIDILAYFLKAKLHIKVGQRIGLMFVNCIDFYIAFYACVKIGAIAVMVNTKMQGAEIEFILSDTETHVLLMNSRWYNKIKPLVKKIGIEKIAFDTLCEVDNKDIDTYNFETIWREYNVPEMVNVEVIKMDWLPAVIMHTSGTTGKPKGVMISHQNIIETAYGYQEVENLNDTDITVLSVPIFHILGLSCVSTMFFYIGATVVITERYNTKKVMENIKKYKATHFHSVPAIYIKMTKEYDKNCDLSSLKITVCGGAPISEENIEAFCKIAPNASFRIAYGMTETAGSGVLSYHHREPGRAVPNVTLNVVDENGKEVPPGEVGEGVFSGPVVIREIWGGGIDESGYLHSGDIIRKDENGYIYVMDRIKDIINRGGEKIFPSVIENVLMGYPGVLQAVVFGVTDSELGEVPAAVLVPEDGYKLDLPSIKKDMENKIAKYEIPQYMEVWDELPVTANGKILKRKLRERFEERKINIKNRKERT